MSPGRFGQRGQRAASRTRRLPRAVPARGAAIAWAVLATTISPAPVLAAAGPPEIRLHAQNQVPACVTPERLMDFIRSRNDALPAKFTTIAVHYRKLGEAMRIRWDYAFYQMVIETNYLRFRRGDGSPGDVSASQNNFAGIGATGGGEPGDRFPDVETGVLAQMQHLIAYSGEKVVAPVAPRTRERQDDIIALSLKLKRPVTFADLARRWAVDRAYAKSIETVADLFRRGHCQPDTAAIEGTNLGTASVAASAPEAAVRPPEPRRAARPAKPPANATAGVTAAPALVGSAAPASSPKAAARPACRLYTASYGDAAEGNQVQLISARHEGQLRVTALTVATSAAEPMTRAFIDAHAPGGMVVGSYPNLEAALAAGRGVCIKG